METLANSAWVADRKCKGRDVAARINSVSSGLAEEDLRTILAGKVLPTTLFVPKIDSVEEIEWLSEKLQKNLPERDKMEHTLRLVFYTESARALLSFRKILKRALELADKRNLFQVGLFNYYSAKFPKSNR